MKSDAGVALAVAVLGYPAFQLLCSILSSRYLKAYQHMTAFEKFDWSQRFPTFAHSILTSLAGAYLLLIHDWRKDSIHLATDRRVTWVVEIEIGYGIEDMVMEFYKKFVHKKSFSLLHWAHHIAVMFLAPTHFYFKKGDFFMGCFFLMNSSTAFLTARQFAIRLGHTDRLWYKLNLMLLIISFFTFRIAVFPLMTWFQSQQSGMPFWAVMFRIPLVCSLSSLSFGALNIYWFGLMLKTGMKNRKAAKGGPGASHANGLAHQTELRSSKKVE